LASKNQKALVLFARDPVAGKVKTRLKQILDEETTLRLYTSFLKDSIDKLFQLQDIQRLIGITPSLSSGFFDPWNEDPRVELFIQQGDDLGDRMRNTFAQQLSAGCEKVVIIGSDSPTLPIEYIERAFASEKDIVLGPSTDGGYYLIGLNRKLADVFSGISWGTDRVLEQTLARIREQAAQLELLPVWYDVDLPEDLRFLKVHSDLMVQSGLQAPGATSQMLGRLKL
jgi:rSAM/selenodomain-associated transferase 1